MKEKLIDSAYLVIPIVVGILLANGLQAYMDKKSILKPKTN
jgi:hypothetical protein